MGNIIYVGIPCYSGRVHAATVDSLMAEVYHARSKGLVLLVNWTLFCSNVSYARDEIARNFLKFQEERNHAAMSLVMIDDDISWKHGELTRLAQDPRPVIGGTYRTKNPEDPAFHVRGPIVDLGGGIYDVAGLPGGFIKIDAGVFETIVPQTYKDTHDVLYCNYFPTGIFGEAFLTEDMGFCEIYRQCGGRVLLDTSYDLGHHDGAQKFRGNAEEYIQSCLTQNC